MKIKVNKLLKMKPVIEKIIKLDIPVMAAWDLMKIVKDLDTELEIYSKARKKLFNKYGEVDEKTKNQKIKEDKVEDFKKDIEELLNKEIEIKTKKIKISSLGNLKLSTADLLTIDILIER